jgi:cyclin-dependent kinase-like
LENLTNTDDTSSSDSANSAKLLSAPLNSFLEKYDLLQKIGEGANACVYKCKHKESGRLFATKKFKFEEEHILELKRNFINLKELRHSSIIRYKALYLDLKQHCAYLVMECFDKPSLAEINISSEEEIKLVAKELVKAI